MLKIFKNRRSCVRLCDMLQTCISQKNTCTQRNGPLLGRTGFLVFNDRQRYFCSPPSNIEEEDGGLSKEEIQELTNGDPELEKRFRIILLEAEVMRQGGQAVPLSSSIKLHHWQELLKLGTRTARKKYFNFLFKVEKTKESETQKKEKKRLKREQAFAQRDENPSEEDGLQYGLGKNFIFMRVRDTTINQFHNNKLIQAMQFGQKMVLDCGYDKHMTSRENINCAKQLMLLFGDNRLHDEPFDLHYCNSNPESLLIQTLNRHIPTLYDDSFPLNIHSKSYLDLFPKEKLVYLTPHCKEEMTTYDHDAIYIIGAIVDKINNEPLSLAKAKKEGIRMAKLPLDRYLQWGAGSGKSLALNQMIMILLDAKATGDWKYALRHVPRRKLYREEDIGTAIKSFNSLSYDVERPRNKSRRDIIPLMELNRTKWTPKKFKEKSPKERLVKIDNVLNE